MTINLLLALAVFAFVTSATPGPNTLMLMASGANFGFRRTVPHMLGIGLGFMFMIALVGLGLMQLFDAWPASYTILKTFSIAYLLYLAWNIAGAAAPGDAKSGGRPLTFLQAAAFQWVNPKAWAISVAAISAYAPDQSLAAIAWVVVVFGALAIPSVSFWTYLGWEIRRFLNSQTRLRAFNWTMAGLLVATLVPILFPDLV